MKKSLIKSRSKCVVCGRVRYQSKMKKINNVWLCNHSSRSFLREMIKINNINIGFNKCQLIYVENFKNNLLSVSTTYNSILISVFGNRVPFLNSSQIVIPELTKKLQ